MISRAVYRHQVRARCDQLVCNRPERRRSCYLRVFRQPRAGRSWAETSTPSRGPAVPTKDKNKGFDPAPFTWSRPCGGTGLGFSMRGPTGMGLESMELVDRATYASRYAGIRRWVFCPGVPLAEDKNRTQPGEIAPSRWPAVLGLGYRHLSGILRAIRPEAFEAISGNGFSIRHQARFFRGSPLCCARSGLEREGFPFPGGNGGRVTWGRATGAPGPVKPG